MATYVEVAKTQEKIVKERLAEVKKALKSKKLDDYNKGMALLKTEVQTWNKCLSNVDFDKFMKTDDPIISAVKQFYVETRKVKEEHDKNNGNVIDVKLDKKKQRIDLKRFCEFGKLSKEWANDSSDLLDLLTLRETNVFALKPSEITEKSLTFMRGVEKKKNGETPDSNTQIVRLIQKIIDEAVFVDNGSGKNAYKCTNHDITFILDACTKFDAKEKCAISMLTPRQFEAVMVGVFAHCLGEAYEVKAAKAKKEA